MSLVENQGQPDVPTVKLDRNGKATVVINNVDLKDFFRLVNHISDFLPAQKLPRRKCVRVKFPLPNKDETPSWRELFPDGRYIYYEGDDPEGFIEEVKTRFGFDPTANCLPNPICRGWFKDDAPVVDWKEEYAESKSFGFHCPPEHLDAIYGGDKYPMGS